MIENPNVICNDCAYCKQNKELCKKIDELYDNIDIWIAENAKFKELLKGAKEIIEWYKADCGYRDVPTEATLQHINQVLGEEQ